MFLLCFIDILFGFQYESELHLVGEEKERLVSELDAARVHKDRLVEERDVLIGELREKCSRLEQVCAKSQADREWMVSEGFKLVFNRARSCKETRVKRDEMTCAVFSSGYQNGLKEGYAFQAQGIPLLEVPTYAPNMEAEAVAAFGAYVAFEPPFLEQVSKVPGIAVEEIQAMSLVEDPPTPSPQG